MDNPETQTTLVKRNRTMTNKIKKHSTESLKDEQYGGETFEKTKGATQNGQFRDTDNTSPKKQNEKKKRKNITQQRVKKVRNMGVKR